MARALIARYPLLARFGSTTMLIIASQGLSSVSLFLLPLLGLSVSDLYATSIQVGTGSYNGLIMGVIYLIALGRPGFDKWTLSAVSAFFFALILAAGTCIVMLHAAQFRSLSPSAFFTILACFGIGGGFLAMVAVEGVRQACHARPWLLAGVTIPANAAMALTIVGMVTFAKDSPTAAILPAIVWMLGNIICYVSVARFLSSRPLPDGPAVRMPAETRINVLTHFGGLALGVLVSTVYPIGFVAAASQIREGAATALFLVSRVGSALVGVFLNSVLLAAHNWSRQEQRISDFSYRAMLGAIACAIVALLAHGLAVTVEIVQYGIIVACWLLCLAATPILLREVNSRRMGSSIAVKSGVDAVISGAGLYIFFRDPTVTGYFSLYSTSQCLTCLICAIALGEKRLAVASSIMAGLSALMLLDGW